MLLPDFERPPVVEVAVSVQFQTPTLNGPQLMLWWSQVRDQFPKLEQLPPLPYAIESFEPSKVERPRIEVQLLGAPPTPRVLMVNRAGTQLIQVQQDHFGYNWRKLSPEHEYPHYQEIRRGFVRELAAFKLFLAKEGLEPLVPTQCEVTYVNHVLGSGVWNRHGELHKVIPSVTTINDFLSEPEEVQFSARYIISDTEKKPFARLYVNVEPRYLMPTMSPIFLMRLTVRGRPQDSGDDGVLKTLDVGHEWIVRGFTALTSVEMHSTWRRVR